MVVVGLMEELRNDFVNLGFASLTFDSMSLARLIAWETEIGL